MITPSTEGLMRELRQFFGSSHPEASLRDCTHLLSSMLLAMQVLSATLLPDEAAQHIDGFTQQCLKSVETACRQALIRPNSTIHQQHTEVADTSNNAQPLRSTEPKKPEQEPSRPVFVQHQEPNAETGTLTAAQERDLVEQHTNQDADHKREHPMLRQWLRDLQGVNLLFVEDQDIQRKLWGAKLNRDGIRADVAETGVEALAQIKSLDNNYYELLVTDITMPKMGGVELRSNLQVNGFQGSVMAQTGHSDDSEVKRLNGMFDFVLNKPYDYGQLIHAIHHVVRFKKNNLSGPVEL